MPELPEVETIVSDLNKLLVGSSVRKVLVTEGSQYLSISKDDIRALVGAAVECVCRHGKYISIFFMGGLVLTIHLRMTGRLFVRDTPNRFKNERVRFVLDNFFLVFTDVRKFGKIWINDEKTFKRNTGIAKLGPEPLSDGYMFEDFRSKINCRKKSIKSLLLDQTIIAGIGNIYADEMLFEAGIRPDFISKDLSVKQLQLLFTAMKKVLRQGIRNRGTSFSDYKDAFSNKGSNQKYLNVYGRGGLSCKKCESLLKVMKIVGRTTVFCENCQK